jgi:hypothetical protein
MFTLRTSADWTHIQVLAGGRIIATLWEEFTKPVLEIRTRCGDTVGFSTSLEGALKTVKECIA